MRSKNNVGRVMCKTLKEQKWLSLGILAAVIGSVVASLLPPLILSDIIDTITSGSMIPLSKVMAYFALIALSGMSESLREGLLIKFGQKITHSLRSSLMEKFTRLTADSLQKQEPGEVVSRFVGDVDMVENLFTSGIISMFADACKIISILAVIWFRNKGLAIVLLILLPGLFWFTRVVQKNMLLSQIENRKAVSRASGHVPQTLRNIRTIHNLKKEKYLEDQYDNYIQSSYRAMEKTNFYDAIYSPVILVLNAAVVAAVMLFSASGNADILKLFGMSAGTAVAVINYISQIFTPIESLGMEIQTIQSAIAGAHRINEFFALEELTSNEEEFEPKPQDKNSALIEFDDVTFAYDEKNILKNLSFKVNKGEQITLLGRTGAGKSTIFKLLLGLYSPKYGQVLIDGKRADSIKDCEKRKVFGYVEQSFRMVPGTVKDQITLFDKNITLGEVREAAKTAGMDDVITNLEKGYDTICTHDIFSQGQWQLLSIARAAVAKPKILLLDEITANLDAQTEKEVLCALKRVSEGRTVISISHRVNAEMGKVIEIG